MARGAAVFEGVVVCSARLCTAVGGTVIVVVVVVVTVGNGCEEMGCGGALSATTSPWRWAPTST